MKLSRVLVQMAGVAALLTSVACSGSGSSVLPTASTPSGATIQGTVEGPAGASQGVSAAQPGVRVSVMGTSLSDLTDAGGGFRLAGVPAGSARLRFEAPGIDAQLAVSGLKDGQVLTVSVRVSGTEASLVSGSSPNPEATPSPNPSPSPDDEREMEFQGRIQSIGTNQLTVDGRRVDVDSNTRIRRKGDAIPFSALKVGDLVEVEGSARSDGSVLARKITVEDDNEDDDNEVEFRGRIQSIGTNQLTVDGRRVDVDGNTRIRRKGDAIPFSALKVGDLVEVEGATRSDGSVLARKITLEDGDENDDDGDGSSGKG